MSIDPQFSTSLQPYNSMAVSVNAHALTRVESVSELQCALAYANENTLPVLVLGEGSNTILQKDYAGLVILNRIKGIELISQDNESVTVSVGAGENWHDFVEFSVNKGWFGLENLALIPGLVGASPIQNIGAYGVEVKDTLESVDFIRIADYQQRRLSNEECDFAYRESCFKQKLADKVVITSVVFRLSKIANVDIRYPALSDQLPSNPTPRDVFNAVVNVRKAKLPLPKDIPNTGSFFKNPVVSDEQHKKLKNKYPDLISYEVGDEFKLAAGWMIERAGWKKRDLNGVTVHAKQALVVINPERRSGQCIIDFAEQIKDDIKNKFDVALEIEPRIYR